MIRILMISSDPTALQPGSRVEERWCEYAELTDKLTVLVATRFWWSRAADRVVSDKLTIMFRGMWSSSLRKIAGEYDLVTAQTPFHDGLFGYMQALRHGVPLQIQIHTDIFSPAFESSFRNRFYLLIARFLIPRATRIRVVSEHLKDALVTSHQLPVTSIDVLPVFVDTEHFKNAPITVDLHTKYPQFDKIVLMLSRLTKEKNIPLGIAAFKELLATYPKAGLVIVGEGPERKVLQKLTTNYGLRTTVAFEPWCADPASYYKTADCFLNTSDYEGYGMTIVEALAAGCPVVSTDVGIAREAGALVAPNNPTAIAGALVGALESPTSERTSSLFPYPSKTAYLAALKQSWEACMAPPKS